MSLAMLLAAPETCSDEAASSSEAAESSTALVETSLTMRSCPSIMVLKDWLSWPISSAAWLEERMVRLPLLASAMRLCSSLTGEASWRLYQTPRAKENRRMTAVTKRALLERAWTSLFMAAVWVRSSFFWTSDKSAKPLSMAATRFRPCVVSWVRLGSLLRLAAITRSPSLR